MFIVMITHIIVKYSRLFVVTEVNSCHLKVAQVTNTESKVCRHRRLSESWVLTELGGGRQ